MRRPTITAICLSGLLAACATSGATSGAASGAAGEGAVPSATSQPGAPRSDASRITSEEIAAANLPTAYDVVERLRRPWLRRSAMGGEVVVYQDERPLGDGSVSTLRDIPATAVAELQYVDNADAVRRWGGGITGAVIVVVQRR